VGTHAALVLGALVMAFPFYWMVTTGLKGPAEALSFPPTLIPKAPTLGNFRQVWQEQPFGRYLLNSGFVSTAVTLGVLVTSSLAAHAFARMRFWGRELLFGAFLATMMIPFEVVLIPDFLIIRQLGWFDSYLALIVPWTASVFGIFLLRQTFLGIPDELFEASQLDGCGHGRFLFRVALPLVTPALVTVALVTFLGSWNSLLWPLVVTHRQELMVVQVGLVSYLGEEGSQYQLVMAAATVSILPIVVLFLAAQRHFVEGIARTGLKS
jgi:multiple sugar transport system permease protein